MGRTGAAESEGSKRNTFIGHRLTTIRKRLILHERNRMLKRSLVGAHNQINLEQIKKQLEEDNPFLADNEKIHLAMKRQVDEAYKSVYQEFEQMGSQPQPLAPELVYHLKEWFQGAASRLRGISTELSNIELEEGLMGLGISSPSQPAENSNFFFGAGVGDASRIQDKRIKANLEVWVRNKPKISEAVESSGQSKNAIFTHFHAILEFWIKISKANSYLVDWVEDVDKLLWFHDDDFGFKKAVPFLLQVAQHFENIASLLT